MKQLLPVLVNHLVDLQPGCKIHILHPPVVELGPDVIGDEEEDGDEDGEKVEVGEQGPSSPICCASIKYKKNEAEASHQVYPLQMEREVWKRYRRSYLGKEKMPLYNTH